MENNQEQIIVDTSLKKKGSLKFKVYLILILLIVGLGAYGYYWFKETNILRIEAQEVINKAQQYDTLYSVVNEERKRCQNFITQEKGDFGSFEYCKKFIDWTDILPSSI
jgi:uncharacterized protein HemX